MTLRLEETWCDLTGGSPKPDLRLALGWMLCLPGHQRSFLAAKTSLHRPPQTCIDLWISTGNVGTVHPPPKCRDRSFVEFVEQTQIRHDLIRLDMTWHDFRVQWPWWTNLCSRWGSCCSWQSRQIEMFCSWLKRSAMLAPLPCLQAASVFSNCNVWRSSHSGGDLQ